MSLKDNFNQALKEILRKDGVAADDYPKENNKNPEPAELAAEEKTETQDMKAVGNYVDENSAAEALASAQTRSAQTDNVQNTMGVQSNYSGAERASGGFGGSVPPVNNTPNTPPPYSGGPSTPYYETEETTVISRNTIIDGSIRSFANINIDGSVKGDVKITKNINVTGKVVGDIECNNSVMTGASMQGSIASKGQVQLDRDSIILGDITAQYLDLNGKIKGNIEVGGKAEFKTDAVVLGNITASTITVLDGATIQGYVNTTFLQESSSSIFPDTIAVTD